MKILLTYSEFNRRYSRLISGVFILFVCLNFLNASTSKNNFYLIKNKADSLYDATDYREAAILYKDLISYSKYFGFRDSVDILLNSGISNYNIGEYDNSLYFINIVLSLLENKKSEQELYVFTLFYKGFIFFKMAKYTEALATYDNIEKLLLKVNNNNFINKVSLYNNRAIIFQSIGDFNNAIQHYERIMHLFESNNIRECENYASVCLNLGVLHTLKKEYSKAIEFTRKGISIQEKLSPKTLANAYNSYAITLKKLGKFAEAEKYYLKAINNRLKYGYMISELSKDYHNYGELLIAQKKYNKALEYLNKAHRQYLKHFGTYSTHTAMCLNSLTNFYIQTNNYSKALEYSQKAIISSSVNFKDNNIFSNPKTNQTLSKLEMLKALKSKAQVLNIVFNQDPTKNLTYLRNSLDAYSTAIEIIEQIRLSYDNDESKMYLSEQEKATYVSAIEVAEKLYRVTNNPHYIEKAFTFAEKSKATTLLANVRNNDALEFGNIPFFVRNIEKELKTNIVFEEKLLQMLINNQKANKKEIEESQNKLFDLRQKLNFFYNYLDKNYKEYYEIKYSPKYTTVAEVQKKLNNKEAVIEYVLTDNKLISFLITNKFYNIYTTNIDSLFYNNLNRVLSYNSANKYGSNSVSDFKNYTIASNYLYQKLFQNFESEIKHYQLTIVPDNQLNLLSFETLLVKPVKNENIDYTGLPYFIKEHPVSYSYSATLLYDDITLDVKFSKNKVLALAPEYQNSGNIANNQEFRNEKFSPLKYTTKEVKNIGKFFDTRLLLGSNANFINFSKLSKDYDILHLAMHADIDDNQPLNSKLLFSIPDNNPANYKQVTIGDIYNMDFDSKLLVLSACNTGNGKVRNGEGALSLARAFMYAGCKSIIMTLWSIEDESSSILMENFYKFLGKGYSKAKALQLAKVEYLKSTPPSKTHPYFWAGFIPVGDQEPITDKKGIDINWAFIFIIAGVGFGLTPIFTNRRVKRSLRRKLRRRILIK